MMSSQPWQTEYPTVSRSGLPMTLASVVNTRLQSGFPASLEWSLSDAIVSEIERT